MKQLELMNLNKMLMMEVGAMMNTNISLIWAMRPEDIHSFIHFWALTFYQGFIRFI